LFLNVVVVVVVVDRFAYVANMDAHEFTTFNVAHDDTDIAQLIEELTNDDDDSNNVVALFADHGAHSSLGVIFGEPTALLENRLPFVSLIIPKKGFFFLFAIVRFVCLKRHCFLVVANLDRICNDNPQLFEMEEGGGGDDTQPNHCSTHKTLSERQFQPLSFDQLHYTMRLIGANESPHATSSELVQYYRRSYLMPRTTCFTPMAHICSCRPEMIVHDRRAHHR
jgi:hypothetical protein